MRIAYGFWRYGADDRNAAAAMIGAAREAGINHFDTADCYGCGEFGVAEELLGALRQEAPSLFDGAEIATKVGVELGTPYNSSREHIAKAVDASLQRLKLERIDLLYIHRPDILAHPIDVAEALNEVVSTGKAKAIGVSNYAPSQIDALASFLITPLRAHQVEFSALYTEPITNGVFDQAMARDIGVYAWSPLAGGKLISASDDQATRVRAALQKYADTAGVSLSAAALSFVTAHPVGAVPIVGTKNPQRLKEAVAATDMSFDRAGWYDVYEASLGEKLP